jgi:predicted permease
VISKFLRRARYFLHRRAMQRDLAEEMAAHREMMPESHRSAFGSELRLLEEARGVWVWSWLDQLRQDLAYAVRMFSCSPGFTLGAISVLALGVGVNLAEFQVFDAAVFHRLSFSGANSIFQLSRISKQRQSAGVPYPAIRVYQRNCTLCSDVVSERAGEDVTIDGEIGLRTKFVSGNYFSALRIAPAWGRLLTEADDSPGAPAVVVFSYPYWKNRWAEDPSVVGRVVHINGQIFQVVGVTPYDFAGLSPSRIAVWLPLVRRSLIPGGPPAESVARPDHMLFVRARPGVPLAAVEAQLTSISRTLARSAPQSFRQDERNLCRRLPGSGIDLKRIPPAALLIVGLVLLVLVSACANLGNMLVARGLSRQRELDTRICLGAGRARVVRQLMTENLLLSVIGGASGLPVALLTTVFLSRALEVPPDIRMSANWRIVCACVMLALFSALLFGLPAALRIMRRDHRAGHRRQMLVAVQVAVSCLLLISSAIIVRGAIRSAAINFAFDYKQMVIVAPQLFSQHLSPSVARQKLDALIERLGRLHGVDAITEAVAPPLGQRNAMRSLPGLPPVWLNPIAPSYFAALKIPLVRGRTFFPGEHDAVIVSESAARAVWPNQDALGKRWLIENALRTVVGVAKDSGANLVADATSVEAYIPDTGAWTDRAALILHTKGDPAHLMGDLAQAGVVAGEPLSIELIRSAHEQALDSQRKMLTVIGSLSAVATLLAAAGMFAFVAFAVAQRTREIGIRMAIGASPFAILSTLLKQNIGPVIVGIAAGTFAGIGLGKITRGLVYMQADPLDPAGFASGIAAFGLIAAVAILAPALKALRIDPASTLRSD